MQPRKWKLRSKYGYLNKEAIFRVYFTWFLRSLSHLYLCMLFLTTKPVNACLILSDKGEVLLRIWFFQKSQKSWKKYKTKVTNYCLHWLQYVFPPKEGSGCCNPSSKEVICVELSFTLLASKLWANDISGHEWKSLFLWNAHSCSIYDMKHAYYPTGSFSPLTSSLCFRITCKEMKWNCIFFLFFFFLLQNQKIFFSTPDRKICCYLYLWALPSW